MAKWAAECEHVVYLPQSMCYYRINPNGDTAINVACHLDSWVCDELPAMQEISSLLDRPTFCKTRFIARSVMKALMKPKQSPYIVWLTIKSIITR